MSEGSIKPGYFDALYASNPDPWNFVGSDYEKRKYAATLAALPRARYGHALELGCSIGVLTEALAARCDRLVAVDAAEAALEQARQRCAALPQVTFARCWVPAEWPVVSGAPFDLILLSEMLYFLAPADIAGLVARLTEGAAIGADIVAVHWTGETNFPLSGDAAMEALQDALGQRVKIISAGRQPEYRLDVMRLGPASEQR